MFPVECVVFLLVGCWFSCETFTFSSSPNPCVRVSPRNGVVTDKPELDDLLHINNLNRGACFSTLLDVEEQQQRK